MSLVLSPSNTKRSPEAIEALLPRQWWYVGPASTSPAGTPAEGPWTLPHLQRAINNGTVESTRLVWTPGMAAWSPAGHQPEFAFDFAPPPLPLPAA